MNYSEAIKYLDSFINYEKLPSYDYRASFKLDRMRFLAGLLGNPHENIKAVHITGTKGKGSTSAIISSILKETGFKTGLYTSPHLISFCERIKINGEDIKEEEVAELAGIVKLAVERQNKYKFSFFEIYTAMAFLYFKMKKCDMAVLEVGLGGRLDGTNIIEKPLVAAITPISLEHTHQLGPTIKDIAVEKAAIIKKDCVCISAPQLPEAGEVIRSECSLKGVKLYEVGRDISYESVSTEKNSEIFTVCGIFKKYAHLESKLLGEHQLINAATAIGIAEALRFHDIIIDSVRIKEGIKKARWPGRLEIMSENPYIILDGAQNGASARALKNAIKRTFKFNKLILILGISNDKDVAGICRELSEISDYVILTKANTPRAEDPTSIKRYINKDSQLTGSVTEAVAFGRKIAKKDGLVLITGSLFVVGEARKRLMAHS
ncbi:MAG: bifunctional folylpolyglutamate synthase/dihydrofolate synthase [Candidatus Omnitrophica bacterium CG07_land_8_20_14_0_80_42_15]|uniref:Dihydrofolate synthase/folylpolyglutamate synthase n=1 Tax=Candidatus Aquitaenariimonas noxiae TaxID=1974741 RepID=A0A2J0KZT0_9BACT|nr:MAG: bifunctional folylpolyglutamate synthase/dihydrofolate synthase [Candidatus Omnitrophica bacterium CG07_land_8_20_14_0_80_42_15]